LLKFVAKAYNMKSLATFVKDKRNEVKLTQEALADRSGVALTVIRKIEQGKENLNLEKVNQVLMMFGHTLAPVNSREVSKTDNTGL
jgi:y4mF family transcriptional regulator